MTFITKPDPSSLDGIAAILPDIAACAQQTEDARSALPANMQALREVGFFDGFKPARFGGSELSPVTMYRAARDIASACASTAWVAQLLAAHSMAIAYYDLRLQDEIWGTEPDTLVSSSVAPVGKAQRVEGGYRLSGRYQWSSGCDHASWALLGVMLEDTESGERLHALAAVPATDYRIEDSWFAAALKGTGSKDIVVEDVFVPAYRVETLMALNTGTARGFGTHRAALFSLPFQPIFAGGFSAVALGIAEAALVHYKARLQDRLRAYTGAKVAASAPAYIHLATAHHEVRAASLLLEAEWQSFADHAEARMPPSPDIMTGWRTNQAFATRMCVSAVDRLFAASGGGALFMSSPLQRCFRDVHGAAAHAYSDYDVASQILGRHLVGLPQDPTLL